MWETCRRALSRTHRISQRRCRIVLGFSRHSSQAHSVQLRHQPRRALPCARKPMRTSCKLPVTCVRSSACSSDPRSSATAMDNIAHALPLAAGPRSRGGWSTAGDGDRARVRVCVCVGIFCVSVCTFKHVNLHAYAYAYNIRIYIYTYDCVAERRSRMQGCAAPTFGVRNC